jgi:hypothetical protein
MGLSVWTLVLASAASAALLLNGGVAKLLFPAQSARALAELFPVVTSGRLPRIVRGFAVAEIAVALALLIAPVRPAAAVVALALGLCFVALGILGRVRSVSLACGCFGESGRHPLGWANVGYGAVLGLTVPLSRLARWQAGPYTAAGPVLAAACAILLCLWLNRREATGAVNGAWAAVQARQK